MKLTLVRPESSLKESYLRALKDFQAEGLPWMVDLDAEAMALNFDAYVEKLLQASVTRTLQLVPETVLWAVASDEFVGRISIRHELNENLRILGGHIGYETAPAFRKKGVASAMLAQALVVAKGLGLNEVLITCDDSNRGSIKVIEKNGGRLQKKALLSHNKPMKCYYLITL